jgi:tetraacyldisaccharide 4'-kinase
MERWLTRQWYSHSAPLLLRPFSWAYAGIVASRRWAYSRSLLRSHRIGRPLLIVGNLTVGGTGKTPLVIWLVQQLTSRGFKVGILSRGYGRKGSAPRMVEINSDWREVGDEPLLIREATQCLTVVAADRVAGAELLVEHGVQAIIADDGLQHLRLERDCEIVVIDGMRGFGNGYLLPAGPLREPLLRLAKVDAVVTNGPANQPGSFEMTLVPGQPLPLAPQAGALGRKVHAVAGIGNPQRFFRTLRKQGFDVLEHPFPDHHAFTCADLRFGDDLPVLMTEKDAVKCRGFADARMWYLPVAAQFSESQARWLLERVFRKLNLELKG